MTALNLCRGHMETLYEGTIKKSAYRIAFARAFWFWLLFMVIGSVVFVIQWFTLVPEQGHTFMQDFMPTLLCYIFIPLAVGFISFCCYAVTRKLMRADQKITVTAENGTVYFSNGIVTIRFTKKDILYISLFEPLIIVGKRTVDIRLKSGMLVKNNQEEGKCHLTRLHVAEDITFAERKEIISKIKSALNA